MACVAFLLLYLVLGALTGWLWLVVAPWCCAIIRFRTVQIQVVGQVASHFEKCPETRKNL